jgi:rRNA small subunit pseudouridine methyltransferase Nep1
MLTIILAESELEIMPGELVNHPLIVSFAHQRRKQPYRILLDSNYHHVAMKDLVDGRRRGRPDITHLFLLTALESIANKKGQLKIIIHTRHDDVIYVNPETRIMRNYDRFVGLIEQLFEKKIIRSQEQTLLELKQKVPLNKVIEELKADKIIAFSEEGKATNLNKYLNDLKKHKEKNIVCIVGGFPSGKFNCDMESIAADIISIYPEMLVAWAVASEILVNYEITYL